jgi:choline-sulfatase
MKLSRRDFVRTAGAAAAASAVPTGIEGATPQPGLQDKTPALERGKHPNLLVILCDQMRFPSVYESDTLKTFRQQQLETQNLLREGGIEFMRHYAGSAACVPGRACMLTGHYPDLCRRQGSM